MRGLDILVQAGASRDAIGGEVGGALVVRLTAPPIDGRANEALCELIAKRLRIAPSRVSITRGERGRRKVVVVKGVDPRTVRRQLEQG